jgi:hypothetical protein
VDGGLRHGRHLGAVVVVVLEQPAVEPRVVEVLERLLSRWSGPAAYPSSAITRSAVSLPMGISSRSRAPVLSWRPR